MTQNDIRYLERLGSKNINSSLFIAFMYEKGYLMPKDIGRACKIYSKLSESGDPFGHYALASAYQLNTEIYNTKQSEIYFLMNESAKQGCSLGKYGLAGCIEYGIGIDQNKKASLALLVEAANEKVSEAACQLGIKYADGIDIESNKKLSFDYFKLSSDLNNEFGAFLLANIYEKGIGVEINFKEAIFYYEKASLLGHSGASMYLSLIFNKGKLGEKIDLQRSSFYLDLSKKNNP